MPFSTVCWHVRRPGAAWQERLSIVAWNGILLARDLIVQAVVLFDQAQHASGPQQSDLVHRGNGLLAQAGQDVQSAQTIWTELHAELLNAHA